ncbi:MAG TPA: DUF1015 domain-containing protein [Propionibacteriaceae bacterium]|nr:DUF1015 domain-containing protein [Propionibacteriaceae bacterium]
MPDFRPFRALRYAADDLGPLTAPPYDVLSDADVDALQARSPHNIVHMDVPRGGEDRYERAAALLRDWVDAGVLALDDHPSFTIYRMRFTDASGEKRDIGGVLGGLEVVDEGAGGVLPHERTTPKASTDRLDLTRATGANLSPVWGLSLTAGLTELLAEPGDELGRVVVDGVEHIVERVTDTARIAAISAAVAADDVLIADGHHRYGISRLYRDEIRAATGSTDSPAEQTLTFVNELVADQLSVAAVHRLYSEITLDALQAALRNRFDLTEMALPTSGTLAAMEAEGFLVLVGPDRAWRLTPLPGAFEDVRPLDGAWLEATLDNSGAEVAYQHGLDEVVDAVRSGRVPAAVLIRPVSLAEIERTAREGLLMPPKSTFFTPKLRTGFVLRPLD